jgi:hypothetical protein
VKRRKPGIINRCSTRQSLKCCKTKKPFHFRGRAFKKSGWPDSTLSLLHANNQYFTNLPERWSPDCSPESDDVIKILMGQI